MHISRTLVELVLRGELPRRFLYEIGQEHLETLCSVCSDGLAVLAEGLAALAEGSPEALGPRPDLVSDPLEAVRRRLDLRERQLRHDERRAREWLKRFFRKVPVSERHDTVRNSYKRYRGSLFGTLLLEEARRAIPDDPAESLSLAEAARISCERTYPEDPDPQVRVPAIAVRGNALRALGRLREAEAELQEARRLLDRSELDDLLIAAEIDRYLGSLRNDQGRHDEAIRHLERAGALYSVVGDREKAVRALLLLGIVHHRLHRFDDAIASTEEVLELLDSESADWLRAYGRFNLALYLHGRGDVERAERELDAHHELIAAGGEGLAFRAGWLRARIAWSREEPDTAERLFRETHRAAAERGIPFDTGLVSLEVALVELVRGRAAEARSLASEALQIFAEQEVERECRAALELLEAAARRDALTREILEQVISTLDRARHAGQPASETS